MTTTHRHRRPHDAAVDRGRRPASTSSCAATSPRCKLHTAAEQLPAVLDQAAAEGLSLTAALERLLAVEVDATEARRLAGRLRFASPAHPRHLGRLRLRRRNPASTAQLVNELGTCRYLESATNVLFIGPPGVGKTHLAVGLARAAADAGYRTYFTTAADLAARCHRAAHRRPLGHHHALLRRPHPAGHRRTRLPARCPPKPPPPCSRSSPSATSRPRIVLTTNRGVASWGEILGDTTVAAAMLDRLLHRSVVLNLDGDTYRLRDHHARTDNSAAPPPAPANHYADHRPGWGISVSTTGEFR